MKFVSKFWKELLKNGDDVPHSELCQTVFTFPCYNYFECMNYKLFVSVFSASM